MSRYVRATKHECTFESWDESLVPSLTVFEPEDKMRQTGLCFPDGTDIMAIDRETIGFVRFA